jgi:hypothetical protein
MRYTGTKYSQAEAEAIMATARATSAAVRADQRRWKAERQQRDGADFVCKTITNARVAEPEPAPVQQSMSAETASWVDWVDARIDEKCAAVIKAVDEALGKMFDTQHEQIQQALDRRDAKIEDLRIGRPHSTKRKGSRFSGNPFGRVNRPMTTRSWTRARVMNGSSSVARLLTPACRDGV